MPLSSRRVAHSIRRPRGCGKSARSRPRAWCTLENAALKRASWGVVVTRRECQQSGRFAMDADEIPARSRDRPATARPAMPRRSKTRRPTAIVHPSVRPVRPTQASAAGGARSDDARQRQVFVGPQSVRRLLRRRKGRVNQAQLQLAEAATRAVPRWSRRGAGASQRLH